LGFAVHRPGIPVSSPRSHRPPGGDVAARFGDGARGGPAGQAGGQFLAPVLAPPGLAGFQLRDRGFDRAAPVRAFPCPGERAFQVPQPPLLALAQPGHGEHLAGGQRRGDGHAPVDADHLAVARRGHRVRDVRERDVPDLISGHTNIVANTGPETGRRKRRFLSAVNGGVSTPRIR